MILKIKKIPYASKTFFQDITTSLVETGFAIITNAPVNHEIINLSYDEWKGFFASESKRTYMFDPRSQFGYFPVGTENAKDQAQPDPKEFFHLYHGYQMPDSIPTQYTQILFELLEQLGQEVLANIDAFYTMSKSQYFNKNRGELVLPEETDLVVEGYRPLMLANISHNSPNTLLRVLHYPALSQEVIAAGQLSRAAAHEDINLITLLPVSTAPGLQVQDRENNWYSVGGDPGDIIINAGDMLQYMTQGQIKSTTHRVVTPKGFGDKPRYSIAVFMHAKPETMIADGKTAGEFLDERLKAIGIRE